MPAIRRWRCRVNHLVAVFAGPLAVSILGLKWAVSILGLKWLA